jgi:hypothetical protein
MQSVKMVTLLWEYLLTARHDMQCFSVMMVIIFQHECRSHTSYVLTNSPSWTYAHQLWLLDKTERHLLHVRRFPDSTCMSVPSARSWSPKPVGSHVMMRSPPTCWQSCYGEITTNLLAVMLWWDHHQPAMLGHMRWLDNRKPTFLTCITRDICNWVLFFLIAKIL